MLQTLTGVPRVDAAVPLRARRPARHPRRRRGVLPRQLVAGRGRDRPGAGHQGRPLPRPGLVLPGLDRRPDARPRADGRPRRRLRPAIGGAALPATARRPPRRTAGHRQGAPGASTTRSPDCPNRSLFRHRIEQVVNAGRRADRTAAVMLIDLDHFKEINDTLGHHAGDRLLQEVSAAPARLARRAGHGRPPRRRRVRRPARRHARSRGGQRGRPAPADPAARAVLDRGPHARGRRQHRHRVRARARLGGRAADPARRHRHVRGQGGRPRPPAVRAAARPLQPAPPLARRRAAVRDRRRRDRPLLPAQGGADHRQDRRRRGARPLAAPAARPHRPVRVRADRRADRPDRPAHLARARGGAQAARRVGRAGRGAERRRQPLRPLVPGRAAGGRDPAPARGHRRRRRAARAGDHREHADARPGAREGDAGPPQRDRPEPLGRRLRHRLLLARQPQAAAGRHASRSTSRS